MKKLIETIYRIPISIWDEVNDLSKKRNDGLSKMGWRHNKGYLWSETNNGENEQTDEHGHKEVPYNRELFYPSPDGRFSLGSFGSVTYISNEQITNDLETDPTLKNNKKISLKAYIEYQKVGCANSKLFYYPIPVGLRNDAKILNIKSSDNPLLKWIAKELSIDNEKFFKTTILGLGQECYYKTQLIALAAYSYGFQGILFKSVRELTDTCCPNLNIVVFEKNIITRI